MGLEEMKDAEGPIDDRSDWHPSCGESAAGEGVPRICAKGLLDDIDALSQKWPDLDFVRFDGNPCLTALKDIP